MKIVDGPWSIKGRRGYAVVMSLVDGDRAEVGDRLQRADGATWVLDGVAVSRAVRGACFLRGDVAPAAGDELARVGS